MPAMLNHKPQCLGSIEVNILGGRPDMWALLACAVRVCTSMCQPSKKEYSEYFLRLNMNRSCRKQASLYRPQIVETHGNLQKKVA